MSSKIEPRLQDALVLVGDSDEPLDVVVRFDLGAVPAVDSSLPIVEQRERRARAAADAVERVLARAGQEAGTRPVHVQTFPLTNSAYIQAPRRYLNALLEQSEVIGAVLNAGARSLQ